MVVLLWLVICYVLGSVPCSLLLAKAFGGIDIRYRGSGNIGATNVMRTAGPKIALPALAADILKGVAAAGLSLYWFSDQPAIIVMASIAVVLGHCYSIFLKFSGGKGVATAAGVILCLVPQVFLLLAVIFALTLAVWRYVSLSALFAALFFPFITLFLHGFGYQFAAALLLSLLVIYRHRENIDRLRQGNESKLGERA